MSGLEDQEEGGGQGAGDAVCCAKQQWRDRVCEELSCNFRHPLRAREQKYLRRSPSGGYDHIVMHCPGWKPGRGPIISLL